MELTNILPSFRQAWIKPLAAEKNMYQTLTCSEHTLQDRHLKANAKPSSCPWCGSQRIAIFMAGMPVYIPELENELDSGAIDFSEGNTENNGPSWQCTECGAQFFRSGQLLRN